MNNQIQTGRIRLSKRLQMSADYVRRGCAAADVGCDHAYMAIYLVQNRIAGRVIAMDINEGPLSRARQNVIQYGLEERIEIRRSDGIRELRPGEADTLLCAGMGGRLMIRILSEGREAADAAEEWILQPQSELLQVRRYIRESGYRIADESMCVEEGKYYISLHAVKQDGSFREPREDRLGDQFGRPLLDRRDPVLRQFLLKEEAAAAKIRSGLSGQTKGGAEALARMEEKLADIREALAMWKDWEDVNGRQNSCDS